MQMSLRPTLSFFFLFPADLFPLTPSELGPLFLGVSPLPFRCILPHYDG
ncbi:uncharacterized protein CTRU02_205579 [Colletotrichum truncatum]|uniref:Uncharacterized protein n=1 Tax=Colletotrichum truncatum TaxID=5467 RepID=A0ACC3Z4G0_COLTU|nr:uncharacterized protein CTRU02_09334 [Colletotrichum truncatum]KAF6788526.1 hypothetical protein CTRU02_09334 [Colletotrichum truncatum]